MDALEEQIYSGRSQSYEWEEQTINVKNIDK
jgi:hypothetical protein